MAINHGYFVISSQNRFLYRKDGTTQPRFLQATKSTAFPCQAVSKPISSSQRAEREAMKRAAQRQREKAAKVTSKGLDSGVLADRVHLPILWYPEPQLTAPKEEPATPGSHCGPRSFHCQEVSKPITLLQRAEREAMKRAAQRQREEAARVTSKGLDSGMLADRVHLPILWCPEPQLTAPKEEPATPGSHCGPRSFHCQEVSKPITLLQRAEREAMKRAAQRQREEAARVTSKGLDSGMLADRVHLPILWYPEPQLTAPKEEPATPGSHCGPRSFHCQEVSKPITLLQRAEREAMKRAAQRQREEAARVTSKGLDSGMLADRVHLPILWYPEPQLTAPKEEPATPGSHCGPRSFHCQEVSKPITLLQRAEREAMKRAAQRQREEAARVTSKGLDSGVLAERVHLPILWYPEPQLIVASEHQEGQGIDCGQRSFHCQELSKPITLLQRAEREALKREAQWQREKASQVTSKGLDCDLLADRIHLPILWYAEPPLTAVKDEQVTTDCSRCLEAPAHIEHLKPVSSSVIKLALEGQEVSKLISSQQRAEREAQKQKAQRQKEEPAKITSESLAYHIHLPYAYICPLEPQLTKEDVADPGKALVHASCFANSNNVTTRKRKGTCVNHGNRSTGNPSKRAKTIIDNIAEPKVCVTKLNLSNRPPGFQKLVGSTTCVSFTRGKGSLDKKPCLYQGERRMQREPIRPHNQKRAELISSDRTQTCRRTDIKKPTSKTQRTGSSMANPLNRGLKNDNLRAQGAGKPDIALNVKSTYGINKRPYERPKGPKAHSVIKASQPAPRMRTRSVCYREV